MNNYYKNILYVCVPSICLGSGIYHSWKDLDDYENLEKENYKSTYNRIIRSTSSFAYGSFLIGPTICLTMPIIVPGTIISSIHSLYYKNKYLLKKRFK